MRTRLRFHIFLVMVVVVLAPLLLILGSHLYDLASASWIKGDLKDAAAEVLAALKGRDLEIQAADPELAGRLQAVATARDLRLRILGSSGALLFDYDQDANATTTVWSWAKGRRQASGARDYDQSLGPLSERSEVTQALSGENQPDCNYTLCGILEVCHYAVALLPPDVAVAAGAPAEITVLHLQESSRRNIRALFDFRFQHSKLTLYNLLIALLLAWWLTRAIVRPVEDLRRQVQERMGAAVPKAGLVVTRRNEIGSLAEAFNGLLGALEQRSKTNEAFLQDLVHEFKNPVAAIRTCAENLQEAGGDVERPKAERVARILTDSSARLEGLVGEFLDLARAEAGLPGQQRERFDLGAMARNLFDEVRSWAQFSDRSFEVVLPDAPLPVIGAPTWMARALRNLVDNAAFFSGTGGRVRILAAREDTWARFEVTDSGPGIPPADLPRMFERFFTTRGKSRGTGLGLALARAIVEAQCGTIEPSNAANGGAVFVVRLPLAEDPHGIPPKP